MSKNGLRINERIEGDIIPFLIRNYIWDKERNAPSKGLSDWFEEKEDIAERTYYGGIRKDFFYWHFTKKGKENICKLIINLY